MSLSFTPQISLLDKRHHRGAFSCGKVPLDTYLQTQAMQDKKRLLAATYVLHEEGQDDIIGFFSLSNASVDPGALPADVSKKLPKQRPIPCTLLAQFAVDQQWQGTGVSNWLLMHVLKMVSNQAEKIASFALLVDAVDEDAHAYWVKQTFMPFPENMSKLYLPMATIKKLFA